MARGGGKYSKAFTKSKEFAPYSKRKVKCSCCHAIIRAYTWKNHYKKFFHERLNSDELDSLTEMQKLHTKYFADRNCIALRRTHIQTLQSLK